MFWEKGKYLFLFFICKLLLDDGGVNIFFVELISIEDVMFLVRCFVVESCDVLNLLFFFLGFIFCFVDLLIVVLDIFGVIDFGLKRREFIEVVFCFVIEVLMEVFVLVDVFGKVGIDNFVEIVIERVGIVNDVILVVMGCIIWVWVVEMESWVIGGDILLGKIRLWKL